MSIIKYVPRSLDRFNWDRILDHFFDNSGFAGETRSPAVDIHEDDSGYHMDVELPGLTEKDVEVKVENGVLSIASRKDEKKDEKKEGYVRRERRVYDFCRSFTLPDSADADGIGATFKNGLLSVSIPKAPASKPKMIEVKTN
jgi:HSP20 family protein